MNLNLNLFPLKAQIGHLLFTFSASRNHYEGKNIISFLFSLIVMVITIITLKEKRVLALANGAKELYFKVEINLLAQSQHRIFLLPMRII